MDAPKPQPAEDAADQPLDPSADAVPTSAGVILPPPVIFLLAIALGVVLEVWLPSRWIPAPIGLIVGIAICTCAVGLLVWTLAVMRQARTAIAPWRTTTQLITSGPFRLLRNPIYLSFTAIHFGLAAITGSAWLLASGLLAFVIVNWGVVSREERYLETIFGETYEHYKQRVDRWL